MAFRSDDRARTDRRQSLERSLEQLDTQLRDLEALRQQRDEVRSELDDLRKDELSARKRELLPVLRRVTVSTPCREKWDKMKGDDRVRFCGRCDKNVYNLSAMTPDEANTFLDAEPSSCVRFFRRQDGTIVTGDCAGGIARRKWTGRLVGAGLAVGAAMGALLGARATDSIGCDLGPGGGAEILGGLSAPEPVMGLAIDPDSLPDPPRDPSDVDVDRTANTNLGHTANTNLGGTRNADSE